MSANAGIPWLVGRERERARLLDEIVGGAPLVTVVGPGGIGKTTLVEVTARDLVTSGSAVVTVPLAQERGPSVAGAVARGMGVPYVDDGLELAVGAALRARACVLVLDNAEHVLDEVRRLVAVWSSSAPNASIVVTSREPLGLPRERVIELPPLDDADARQLVLQLATASHEWSEQERARIARLAIALEGVPLALVLVAGRLRTLGLEVVEKKMSDPLGLLRVARESTERETAFERSIAWSWDLLDDRERSSLGALTVFVAPFDVEAAEAVLACDDAADLVALLVEKALLRSFGNGRFGFFALIREFIARRGVTPPAARRRHAEHFLGTMAAYDQSWVVDADRVPTDLAEADLARAVDHALDEGVELDASTCARALIGLAARLPSARTGPTEPNAWLARFARAEHLVLNATAEGRASFLASRADLEYRYGSAQESAALARRAVALLSEPSDLRAIALARWAHSEIATDRDDAFRLLQRALAEATEPSTKQMVLGRLAGLHIIRGDSLAVAKTVQAMSEIGPLTTYGRFLFGTALCMAGRHAEGRRELGKLRHDEATPSDRSLAAFGTFNRGASLVETGELDDALRTYEEAESAFRSLGNVQLGAKARGTIGALRIARGERTAGATMMRAAIAELETRGERVFTPKLRALLALVLRAEGQSQQAEHVFDCAVAESGDTSRAFVLAARGTPDDKLEMQSFDRALLDAVRRGLGTHARPEAPRAYVARRGTWVRTNQGDRVDLSTRTPLQRLVVALARHRLDMTKAGSFIAHDELVAAGWPDDTCSHESGRARLRVAMSELRKLGLRDAIESSRVGHRLAIPLEWADD